MEGLRGGRGGGVREMRGEGGGDFAGSCFFP